MFPSSTCFFSSSYSMRRFSYSRSDTRRARVCAREADIENHFCCIFKPPRDLFLVPLSKAIARRAVPPTTKHHTHHTNTPTHPQKKKPNKKNKNKTTKT